MQRRWCWCWWEMEWRTRDAKEKERESDIFSKIFRFYFLHVKQTDYFIFVSLGSFFYTSCASSSPAHSFFCCCKMPRQTTTAAAASRKWRRRKSQVFRRAIRDCVSKCRKRAKPSGCSKVGLRHCLFSLENHFLFSSCSLSPSLSPRCSRAREENQLKVFPFAVFHEEVQIKTTIVNKFYLTFQFRFVDFSVWFCRIFRICISNLPIPFGNSDYVAAVCCVRRVREHSAMRFVRRKSFLTLNSRCVCTQTEHAKRIWLYFNGDGTAPDHIIHPGYSGETTKSFASTIKFGISE